MNSTKKKTKKKRVVQKVLSFVQEELEKQDSFSLFFNRNPLDINAFYSTMLKHCNPITEDGILILKKLLHGT